MPSKIAPPARSQSVPRPATPRALTPVFDHEPKTLSDLERQADDIIANFRARHNTGLELL